MVTVDHFASTSTKPEIRRDYNGRPFVKQLDTGREITYRRVTTFIDVLDDRFKLEQWKQRMVAVGLAKRHDLLMQVAAFVGDPDGKKEELNKLCDSAREAGGDTQAANIGQAVHSLSHQIDHGLEALVPPSAKPDLDAYRQLLTTERLKPVEIETFVVLDDLKVAGSFDRIYELDGQRFVGDIKTGSLFGGSKMEIQLACYASGKRYNIATGERTELNVDQTRGLIIHIPAGQGQASMHWADLERGQYGIALCDLIWQWRGQNAGALTAGPPRPPDLFALIASMDGDREAYKALWRAHKAHWTPEATAAVEARLAGQHRLTPVR